MNKYPLWKYLLVAFAVLAGLIYALPNLYGEYPAIQISPTRTTKLDAPVLAHVEQLLQRAQLPYSATQIDDKGARVRFADTGTQLRARDLVSRELGDGYTVALNLLPDTPKWLQTLNARPMYLGLDLRGGVYFLMQVDMRAVLKKAGEIYADDIRRILRDKKLRYLSVNRLESGVLETRFKEAAEREQALPVLRKELRDLTYQERARSGELIVPARLSETVLRKKKRFAPEQNISSLNNRVNELGVAEPVIQQQGEDRIVVQLPGVQDTAKAKSIIGRTATLEIMLVDEERDVASALAGQVPSGSKLYKMRNGQPILLKNRLIYSGDNIVDSAPGFDSQSARPIVSITLDARGASINQRVTGENVGKRMAVVYIEIKSEPKLDEQGRPMLDEQGRALRVSKRVEEGVTAPVIRSQLGKRFQIEGMDSVQEANELSLLLRAGALAAPVEIIEERTVGPSLGQENIEQGVKATIIGFIAVGVLFGFFYKLFGLIANVALPLNLVLPVAVLSLFQATLTLPGIAGVLLTLGMAVDANVLINERIREEIRNGNTPQASI